MNSKYKDKLVGVYAPGSYSHTSVLGQTQEYGAYQHQARNQCNETQPYSNA